MHMAQIKKLTPQITEKNVCVFSGYEHSELYSYTLIGLFIYKKITNSFQSSMSRHPAVMEDFMNRKRKLKV